MEVNNEQAGWISGIAVAIVAAWKFFIGAKKELRDDKGDVAQHDGYKELIQELREELKRKADDLEEKDVRIHALEETISEMRVPKHPHGGSLP